MRKKLNWYDVIETERIQVKEEDYLIVVECIENGIALTYDTDTLHIYDEVGDYIADIESIQED